MVLVAVICNHLSRSLSFFVCLTHTRKQVCGGSGIPAGKCSCAGDVADACGACGGDGSSCAGCDGVANSGKTVDLCGVCDGGGIASGTCNCAGDVLDQCGVCTNVLMCEEKLTHLASRISDST